jgi:hypothetical protein
MKKGHGGCRRALATANLPSWGGFEGMAINRDGTRLYTLLEQPVAGDPAKMLRIDEFDIAAERYTGRRFFYRLDPAGTNIGDMVAVDDQRFVVIERNGSTATSPASAPPPGSGVRPSGHTSHAERPGRPSVRPRHEPRHRPGFGRRLRYAEPRLQLRRHTGAGGAPARRPRCRREPESCPFRAELLRRPRLRSAPEGDECDLHRGGPERVEDELEDVRQIDVAPTILAILGVPPAETVQGRALRLCGKHGNDRGHGGHGHDD